MPKTPKGHKRPADVIANAVHVMRIATGEADEGDKPEPKNAAAVALGRLGGTARAKTLSKRRKVEIAKAGGAARAKSRREGARRQVTGR